MKENWLKIKGYDGYEVSDLGRVRSLNYNRTGETRLLKPGLGKNGYLIVVLCKNRKQKVFYVHKLVVEAFIGPIPKGKVVNHLNEIKTDNRLENLEITTYKKNNNHGTRNERAAKALSKSLLGNANGAKELKLTNAKTSAKYAFSSSVEASAFFSYKHKCTVGALISDARKRGENFINIRQEKYYFSQSA